MGIGSIKDIIIEEYLEQKIGDEEYYPQKVKDEEYVSQRIVIKDSTYFP